MPKIKHLSEYHKRALELKYKGHSYESIADDLNRKAPKSRKAKFTEQSVKDWFKEAGTLYETYRIYEDEMDQIHIETMNIVRRAGARIREQNFRLANEMLVALMGSANDSVKMSAIREILDRVEGKPKETIHVNPEELEQLSVEDRWLMVPYEIRLALSRDQYKSESTEKADHWLATGRPPKGGFKKQDYANDQSV
ncbi:MAG: hypothetical protein ABSC29_00325 [Minisyncoccia bacterium]|jgi:hypothetical protein